LLPAGRAISDTIVCMMPRCVALAALLCAAAFPQSAKIPGWFLTGNNPRAYAIGLDNEVKHAGAASAAMGCALGKCQGFATLMQTFRADKLRGKRVRLTAWVKAANSSRANIWMRVDGAGATLAFDNMEHRKARGTFDWRQQQIALDVPDIAFTVSYGLILEGNGQAWVDDFTFEIVDKHVKTTAPAGHSSPANQRLTDEQFQKLPPQPVNTDFEQPPGTR
jgi:hypothetical protein